MKIPTLRLANGSQMPVIGLGLWKVDGAAAPALVEEAARAGYRHFDCASDYGNEADVGSWPAKCRAIGRRSSRGSVGHIETVEHQPFGRACATCVRAVASGFETRLS